MPEGDAVRRLATTLTDVFGGQCCEMSSPQGRFASSAALLDGWVMERVEAHGKHMFVGFVPPERSEGGTAEIDHWIHIHLGLYGTWRFSGDATVRDHGHAVLERLAPEPERNGPEGAHKAERWSHGGHYEDGTWNPPEPIGQVRLRIITPYAVGDLSGPNRCEVITDAERQVALEKLGPDPLVRGARDDEEATQKFVQAVRARKRAIGELMMDQSIVAGVGNIYRADILFLAGLSPMRTGNRIAASRVAELWRLTCDIMNRGLAAGRLDTMDPQEAPEQEIPGDAEASRWYVYHRTGRPCLRCATPVAEKLMQGRRLFWCPSCQR